MNFNEAARDIHRNAVKHGWWDRPVTVGESIALIHAELSEALGEYRNGNPIEYFKKVRMVNPLHDPEVHKETNMSLAQRDDKPEGIATELADVVIRILDLSDEKRYDMDIYPMDYNSIAKTETFGDMISMCHACLTYAYMGWVTDEDWKMPQFLHDCILYIFRWSKENGLSMTDVMMRKHLYNQTREYRHGGKIL